MKRIAKYVCGSTPMPIDSNANADGIAIGKGRLDEPKSPGAAMPPKLKEERCRGGPPTSSQGHEQVAQSKSGRTFTWDQPNGGSPMSDQADCILFPLAQDTPDPEREAWQVLRQVFGENGATLDEFLNHLLEDAKVRGPREACRMRVEALLKAMMEFTGYERVEIDRDGRYRAVGRQGV
jgi:hypothetical protein